MTVKQIKYTKEIETDNYIFKLRSPLLLFIYYEYSLYYVDDSEIDIYEWAESLESLEKLYKLALELTYETYLNNRNNIIDEEECRKERLLHRFSCIQRKGV